MRRERICSLAASPSERHSNLRLLLLLPRCRRTESIGGFFPLLSPVSVRNAQTRSWWWWFVRTRTRQCERSGAQWARKHTHTVSGGVVRVRVCVCARLRVQPAQEAHRIGGGAHTHETVPAASQSHRFVSSPSACENHSLALDKGV